MPRKLQKGLDNEVAPITANEVEQMFRSASSQGPYPDPDDYVQMAELLTGSILSYSSDIILYREQKAVVEAAKRLQKLLDSLVSQRPVHSSVANLLTVLPVAIGHLAPPTQASQRKGVTDQPWAVAAAVAAETCKRALEGLRRRTGITPTSVMVVFAAKATQRMGFQGVSANSVHKLLTALRDRPGETPPGASYSLQRPPASRQVPNSTGQLPGGARNSENDR